MWKEKVQIICYELIELKVENFIKEHALGQRLQEVGDVSPLDN